MKKALVLALCVVLAGMLAVDDTFAAEFTQAVREAAYTLFQTVSNLAEGVSPDPTTAPGTFEVALAYPGGSAGMALLTPGKTTEREVAVTNQSNGKSAYFRIVFAVQSDVREHLNLNFSEDPSYIWSGWRTGLIIDGREFDINIGTYTDKLAAGKTSPAALRSVTLKNITSQQMSAFDEDFLQIQVMSICADDFAGSEYDSAEAALDQALPISSNDFNPFK